MTAAHVIVTLVSAVWWSPQVAGLAYSIDNTITRFEPVILGYRFQDASDEPVQFPLSGYDNDYFRIQVTGPDGRTTTREPVTFGSLTIPRVTLPAHRSRSDSFILNEWFDLNVAGTYRVNVRYTQSVVTTSGTPVPIQSETVLTVEVRERDEAALRRRCQLLLDRILVQGEPGDRSATGRVRSAQALAFVRDPVAVPYLRRAIEADVEVDLIAFDGLVRIGGPQALSVLESLCESARPDVAGWARQAIRRIRSR